MNMVDRNDFASRPAVSIGREDDVAVLRTPAPDELFTYMSRASVRGGYLRAFSIAPRADLPFLDGKVFFRYGQTFRLKQERSVPLRFDPYLHRLFRIEDAGVVVQQDQETGKAEVRESRSRDDSFLFLDPIAVPLSREEARKLFLDLRKGNRYGDIEGGCFVPPVRVLDEEGEHSYFSQEALRFRATLRRSANMAVPTPSEPAAVYIQRLCDEPILRDTLLDGSALRLTGGEGEPTGVQLTIARPTDPIEETRESALIDGSLPGPAWAAYVARALKNDVTTLVPCAHSREGEAPPMTTWDVDEAPSPNPVGFDNGSWHVMFRNLGPRLKDVEPASKAFLDTRVLSPAQLPIDRKYDHSLAERLFRGFAWRCPWKSRWEDDGWHRALIDLLPTELSGSPVEAADRIASWNAALSEPLQRVSVTFVMDDTKHDALHVRYTGTPDDEDMVRRRLLLPMGTVLNARMFWLDRGVQSELDRGLVLS